MDKNGDGKLTRKELLIGLKKSPAVAWLNGLAVKGNVVFQKVQVLRSRAGTKNQTKGGKVATASVIGVRSTPDCLDWTHAEVRTLFEISGSDLEQIQADFEGQGKPGNLLSARHARLEAVETARLDRPEVRLWRNSAFQAEA